MFDLNARSVVSMTRAAAAPWLGRNGGFVINTTSIAARNGGGGAVLYAAAKGFVSTLTRGQAKELIRESVRPTGDGAATVPRSGYARALRDRFCGLEGLARSRRSMSFGHLLCFVFVRRVVQRSGATCASRAASRGRGLPMAAAGGGRGRAVSDGERVVLRHPAGPCASARILARASRIVASASAPPPSRTITVSAADTPPRQADHMETQSLHALARPALAQRQAIFIAAFRLNARIDRATRPRLAPNKPEGICPPAKSDFNPEWTSSLLPQRSATDRSRRRPDPGGWSRRRTAWEVPCGRSLLSGTAVFPRRPAPIGAAARGSPEKR